MTTEAIGLAELFYKHAKSENAKRRPNKMDIKSRYEVVAELEDKKRKFIVERDSFPDMIKSRARKIRDAERELEDDKEELAEFESVVEDKKITIQELIKSIDESLERFSKLDKKS